MTLVPGDRLGPYEIVSPLGAGGMGEVWKAKDTRLDRFVAVKVLPARLSKDAELLARFEREARAVAALNHPNILALHDIGTQEGVVYAVMELLEGESLRTRLEQGPLPPRKAIELAVQAARGLAAAHEKGVVHRDLKPDNLWVTKDGRLKILDFGLAKQLLRQESGYMSPEQVRGESVDARSDLFSFGAVLFEMLTGTRAFARGSATETLAAILRDDPTELEPTTSRSIPAGLERIVRHCLEKSPDQRFRSAHDVAFALENASSASERSVPFTAPFAPQNRKTSWKWAGLAALLLLAACVGAWALGRRGAAGPSHRAAGGGAGEVTRLSIVLPEGDLLAETNRLPLALSPDGRLLAYVGLRNGKRQLFLRALSEREPGAVPGTEGAATPFFSPDGQWIAFFAQGALKRVAVGGAGLQVICGNVAESRGGSWGSDGNIYYAPSNSSGLSVVPASGGTPKELTLVEREKGEISHRWPHVLPDARTLLFTIWTGPGKDERQIVAQSLETGERQVLVPGGDTARYLPSGFLLYARQDSLYAVPWRAGQPGAGSAAPVTLSEYPRLENEGAAAYAVSDSGTLAYLEGGPTRYSYRLVWVDRDGKVEPLPFPERDYEAVAIAPDGQRAVVQVSEGTVGLWIFDFTRHTMTPLVTTGGSSQAPVWTTDGSRVAYRATRRGTRTVYWKASDGTGDEQPLTVGRGVTETPTSVSPDGQWLVFQDIGGEAKGAITTWRMRLSGDRTPQPLGQPGSTQTGGQVSPDGRWLAFVSSASGQNELYVQPYPGPGPSKLLSSGGGSEPRWSRDGRELFYVSGSRFLAVDVPARPGAPWGEPRVLFEGQFRRASNANTASDVSPDGGRFLRIQQSVPDRSQDHIDVVLNWHAELDAKAPAR
ncbi:MAG: serine/threonine-protein kinase [Acidobacteria bacterium]|nr:serine/threonine-protein kinase [Acidobacteriota bacterium]